MLEEVCSICGRKPSFPRFREFGGQRLCLFCLLNRTEICEKCGRRIVKEDVNHVGDRIFCPECVANHCTYCSRCGSIVLNSELRTLSNGDGCCESCYQALEINEKIK